MTFLLILDGADEVVDSHRGVSLFDVAALPHLNQIRVHGLSGQAEFFVPGRDADSLTCILTMLGVPAAELPVSRAPLEALAAGIEIENEDLVYRCNLISAKDGRLTAFNGGGLGAAEMRDLSLSAARLCPSGLKFFHLSDYRNILLVKNFAANGKLPDAPPPHENVGRQLNQLLGGISQNPDLSDFIQKSHDIHKGYSFYPWGAGKKESIPSYRKLTGRSAGCVCKADIVAGIAKAMGMHVCVPSGATGDFDTDLAAKAEAALNLAHQYDTVIIHVNGTDELAHRQDLSGKMRFLEKIDANLIGKIVSSANGNTRILITSDHVTSSRTGKHQKLPVMWFCADLRNGMFPPPPVDASLDGRQQFDWLLRGK